MDEGEPNPWDVKVKHIKHRCSKPVRLSQEKYAERLKTNRSCASYSFIHGISARRISEVTTKFQLPLPVPSCLDDKENCPEDISASFIPVKENTGFSTVAQSDRSNVSLKLSKIPLVLERSLGSLDKPHSPKSKYFRRGSFLGKPQVPPTEPVADTVHLDETNTTQPQFDKSCQLSVVYETTNLSRVSPKPAREVPSDVVTSSSTPDTTGGSSKAVDMITDVITSYKQKSGTRCRPPPTQNYLKLNLRKKCFSRKGSMRQRALQRKVRSMKFKRRFGNSGPNKSYGNCFRCGAAGHWANKCPSTIGDSKPAVESHTNSLHASRLSSASWRILTTKELDTRFAPAQFEDLFQVPDIHGTNGLGNKYTTEELRMRIQSSLKTLGFKSFRAGQELIVLRILLGISTLAVLPTAAGKSLCYQLPAYICQQLCSTVALVVSPLISLMEDQVIKLHTGVEGAYLNSSQSASTKEDILQKARSGQYAFLLVSPEALVESDWLLQPGRLPPISFVCIDEAHCLADWSHHFRPSYLRVCSLMRNFLGVKCFLGLSATCTPATIVNVCKNLHINDPVRFVGDTIDGASLSQPGYVQPSFSPIPPNLTITASLDAQRDEALISLLGRPPFNELTGGILIYCATRENTERLASFIRTSLQDVVNQIGRRRLHWTTAAYHAGQTSSERSRIQKRFMTGRVRVLVATSAFGMGLNKSDLQAVIHYSLTKSFENYVQEIGRVGRTQQLSYCHAFLPPTLISDPREANELRRHVFTNHIDAVMLKRLLRLLFDQVKCTCRLREDAKGQCGGHVFAIDPVVTGEAVDMKPESLATVLAYMELDPDGPLISILQPGYSTAVIDCYGGPAELAYASQRCLAVAGSLALTAEKENAEQFACLRQLKLSLPELCNRWGWRPNAVKQELKTLEWDSGGTDAANRVPYRTGINVSLSQWSWWFWVNGSQLPLSAERLDKCLDYLIRRLSKIENASLSSLDRLTRTLSSVAEPSFDQIYPLSSTHSTQESAAKQADNDFISKRREERSRAVHELIRTYFLDFDADSSVCALHKKQDMNSDRMDFCWPPPVTENQINIIRASVRDFIKVHGPSLENRVTGRTLANIFHGISTPQFPATTWSRCHRYWRAHLDVDWPCIKRVATEELLNYITLL